MTPSSPLWSAGHDPDLASCVKDVYDGSWDSDGSRSTGGVEGAAGETSAGSSTKGTEREGTQKFLGTGPRWDTWTGSFGWGEGRNQIEGQEGTPDTVILVLNLVTVVTLTLRMGPRTTREVSAHLEPSCDPRRLESDEHLCYRRYEGRNDPTPSYLSSVHPSPCPYSLHRRERDICSTITEED